MKKKDAAYAMKHTSLSILIVLLAVFLFSLTTGCTATEDPNTDEPLASEPETGDTSPEASISESSLPEVDHNVDLTPLPLPEEETKLSLEGYGAVGALSDEDLTLADMLRYAVEDEYLARGEYLEILDRFGSQRPYTNIVRSEEMHLSYLEEVYASYGLPFPEDSSMDHLIVPEDLLEAARTGVQAEIDNIAMYEKFMTYDLPDNLYNVFDALKKGSDSHLLAFQKQVDRLK